MSPTTPPPPFAERLLTWWRANGRHDLPWQRPREAYRVWVSEIMLQQTRVETVIGYFDRFMQRFPDIEALAVAELDDVLALWSGLGYYARARNLHSAAREVRERFDGALPADADALAQLPGIGRSTAAAIVAQAFDRRAVILDGNVKRVLARHAAIQGWPGASAVERELWQAADARTPVEDAADYTQAIMDLGATLCTPRSPACDACPVAADCLALEHKRQHELPTPRPTRKLPERASRYLLARDGSDRVLLVRRPPSGVWGGLWCLPEAGDIEIEALEVLPEPRAIRHVFTHFALQMSFEHVRVGTTPANVSEGAGRQWFTPEQALAAGLPQPVRRVLKALSDHV
ncbi:MAG: A/G-specific adenine glycosylase [Wenzhouxiangellaceae bacterium]|nr:A/G-specific adenine glycosylase [Wenzhouxiangellaceae bacterium]MBS3822806.1 A/G-specific adenine glycosylase [Wenzhouxiangellaceae bacterium]